MTNNLRDLRRKKKPSERPTYRAPEVKPLSEKEEPVAHAGQRHSISATSHHAALVLAMLESFARQRTRSEPSEARRKAMERQTEAGNHVIVHERGEG